MPGQYDISEINQAFDILVDGGVVAVDFKSGKVLKGMKDLFVLYGELKDNFDVALLGKQLTELDDEDKAGALAHLQGKLGLVELPSEDVLLDIGALLLDGDGLLQANLAYKARVEALIAKIKGA